MSKEINVKHHLKENELKKTGTGENGFKKNGRYPYGHNKSYRDNSEYKKWVKVKTEDSMKKMDNLACASTEEEQVEEFDESEDFMEEMDDLACANKNKEDTNQQGIPKVDIQQIFPKKKKKCKETKYLSNEEFNPYTFAVEILNKYRIWHLDSSDWSLWIWNGRFYEPLNDDKLESLIYGDLPEEFKSTLKSCKKSIQATSEFICRECEVRPIKSEKSGRSYKTFNKKDMRKIYNSFEEWSLRCYGWENDRV